MKRIILILTIIMILSSTMFLCINNVQAYSGKIDPEDYILPPSQINIENGIGTGTIGLLTNESGYNIYYQKIDLTNEQYNAIKEKSDEAQNYYNTQSTILLEKETNVTSLETTYHNLQNDETATAEQIETARTNYETAAAEYEEYRTNVITQYETLQKQKLALVPDFTSAWVSTTNSALNVQLDFTNYTEIPYFALWIKIENGTNTYYDVNCYSSQPNDQSDTPDSTGGEWTDFSNARFELKKEGATKAIIEISGITPKETNNYYLYISPNNSKPTGTGSVLDGGIRLSYDKNTKTLKSDDIDEVAAYVELNQDLYASVIETNSTSHNISTYANKLNRYEEPKYSDAFTSSTFMTHNGDQIITTFTHGKSNNRKMQIKVGKITDTSILNKIKNKNSSGFEELLNFARSNSGIYDQIKDANKEKNYIEYEYDDPSGTIDLKGLQDGEYYYLYVKTQDENGKYISNEAVTLAQASVYDDSWYMFFYGTSDFKWSEWDTSGGTSGGSSKIDNTVAPGVLPNTGIQYVISGGIILTVAIASFIAYKKYKKFNSLDNK